MDNEIQMVAVLKKALTDHEKIQFDTQFASNRKDPRNALVLSVLLGGLGIDRFYIGDIGLGIGKLLTFGGLGIWMVIDWFFIRKATRRKNYDMGRELKNAMVQMRSAE